MDISLLNVRITFQKNTVVVDHAGNHRNVWEDHYLCYATISNEDGTEEDSGAVTVKNENVSFTVRYCRQTAALTTDGYRIWFHGKSYDIQSIDYLNYKKKALKFKCRLEGK